MKRRVYNLYRRSNRVIEADLEHPVDGEYFENPERIADVYLKLADGTEVAIEIQCSPQSVSAFDQRTEAYNQHGIHVLWVIQEETYLPEKTSQDGSINGVSFKDSVKWLQRHYYGRSYVFNESTAEGSNNELFTPTRIERVSTHKEGYNEYGEYFERRYTYKSLGKTTRGNIPNHGLLATDSQGKKIARFYDSCWWGEDQ